MYDDVVYFKGTSKPRLRHSILDICILYFASSHQDNSSRPPTIYEY